MRFWTSRFCCELCSQCPASVISADLHLETKLIHLVYNMYENIYRTMSRACRFHVFITLVSFSLLYIADNYILALGILIVNNSFPFILIPFGLLSCGPVKLGFLFLIIWIVWIWAWPLRHSRQIWKCFKCIWYVFFNSQIITCY